MVSSLSSFGSRNFLNNTLTISFWNRFLWDNSSRQSNEQLVTPALSRAALMSSLTFGGYLASQAINCKALDRVLRRREGLTAAVPVGALSRHPGLCQSLDPRRTAATLRLIRRPKRCKWPRLNVGFLVAHTSSLSRRRAGGRWRIWAASPVGCPV